MNLASLAGEPVSIHVNDQTFRVRPGTVRGVAKLQAWINAHPPASSSARPADHAPPPAAVMEARSKAPKWQPPDATSEEGLQHLIQSEGGVEQLLQAALAPEHPEVNADLARELADVLPYQAVNLIFLAFAMGLDIENKEPDDLPKFLRPPTAASPGTTTPDTSADATGSVTTSS